MATSTSPSTAEHTVTDKATARRVVGNALRMYADAPGTTDAEADLALAMSQNVTGWTHTTRLRDFLDGLAR